MCSPLSVKYGAIEMTAIISSSSSFFLGGGGGAGESIELHM